MRTIVLGMHRSGTSALAGVLDALGVDIGATNPMIGSSVHNPRGHREVAAVVIANEMLLHRAGGSWWSPPGVDALAGLADVGRDTVASGEWDGGPTLTEPWALKDPRFSLTLPFWTEVHGHRTRVVMVVRDPIAVAVSLDRRHRFGLDPGLALWERYNRAAITFCEGQEVLLVRFEDLFERVDPLIDDLVAFCGAPRPTAEGRAAAAASVERALDRSSSPAGRPAGRSPTYDAIVELAGVHGRFPGVALEDEDEALAAHFPTEAPRTFGRGR